MSCLHPAVCIERTGGLVTAGTQFWRTARDLDTHWRRAWAAAEKEWCLVCHLSLHLCLSYSIPVISLLCQICHVSYVCHSCQYLSHLSCCHSCHLFVSSVMNVLFVPIFCYIYHVYYVCHSCHHPVTSVTLQPLPVCSLSISGWLDWVPCTPVLSSGYNPVATLWWGNDTS